jgi:hypothetical protein
MMYKMNDGNDGNDGNTANEVIVLFANFINYLNASYYEAQFTQKHEEARANINAIYDTVSKTPNLPPTSDQCSSFYNDIRVLANVTYTEDPDYFIYKRLLRKYIAAAAAEAAAVMNNSTSRE